MTTVCAYTLQLVLMSFLWVSRSSSSQLHWASSLLSVSSSWRHHHIDDAAVLQWRLQGAQLAARHFSQFQLACWNLALYRSRPTTAQVTTTGSTRPSAIRTTAEYSRWQMISTSVEDRRSTPNRRHHQGWILDTNLRDEMTTWDPRRSADVWTCGHSAPLSSSTPELTPTSRITDVRPWRTGRLAQCQPGWTLACLECSPVSARSRHRRQSRNHRRTWASWAVNVPGDNRQSAPWTAHRHGTCLRCRWTFVVAPEAQSAHLASACYLRSTYTSTSTATLTRCWCTLSTDINVVRCTTAASATPLRLLQPTALRTPTRENLILIAVVVT